MKLSWKPSKRGRERARGEKTKPDVETFFSDIMPQLYLTQGRIGQQFSRVEELKTTVLRRPVQA
ncbi:hypothetical protein J6590_079550 [Homalodisca vitripennis]|nr:hypothetical protein J6590_079550 [Homalodisca vitripennis]